MLKHDTLHDGRKTSVVSTMLADVVKTVDLFP